jgi:Fe-S cluster biogenesis protein NfuA
VSVADAQRGEVNQVKEEVQQALNDIRPALQADGGDIELVEVTEDGVVRVRLQGHCAGCPMSQMTLTHGVERHLKNVVPGVDRVENVAIA